MCTAPSDGDSGCRTEGAGLGASKPSGGQDTELTACPDYRQLILYYYWAAGEGDAGGGRVAAEQRHLDHGGCAPRRAMGIQGVGLRVQG